MLEDVDEEELVSSRNLLEMQTTKRVLVWVLGCRGQGWRSSANVWRCSKRVRLEVVCSNRALTGHGVARCGLGFGWSGKQKVLGRVGDGEENKLGIS